jgi:hypothetical protein
MNTALYALEQTGGILCSEPVLLSAFNQTLKINHAMSRPPDLMFLRLTCQVADSGWLPGDVHHLYGHGSATAHFYISAKPGLVTGFIYGSSLGVESKSADGISTMTVTSWKVELVAVWFPGMPASL